jgi:hypothetical protein
MSTRKQKNLLFTLSMPNPPSWNGKWSGADNFYGLIRAVKDEEKAAKILAEKHYGYRWEDGWFASIEVGEITDAKELAKLRRKVGRFCGYEWMVDDIVKYGEIKKR